LKKFKLVNNSGEVVNVVNAYDYEDAIEYFAKVKDLNIIYLLKIFKVIENK